MTKSESAIHNTRKAVCRRINKALNGRGWTQKELAKQWDRSESQVSKLLNGKVDMQLSTISEIEEVLGINIIVKD